MNNSDYKNKDKILYNSNYVAETYSENYKLATSSSKKEKTTSSKIVASITVVLTVLIVSISRLISGIDITENSIITNSYSIEYDFTIDYNTDDNLIIKLYNDNYSEEVIVDSYNMKGQFIDLTENTEYTLEIINDGTVIYTNTITTEVSTNE